MIFLKVEGLHSVEDLYSCYIKRIQLNAQAGYECGERQLKQKKVWTLAGRLLSDLCFKQKFLRKVRCVTRGEMEKLAVM